MKFALFVIIFSLSTSIFAETKLDESTCIRLKYSTTHKISKSGAVDDMMKNLKVKEDAGREFIKMVQANVDLDLDNYCTRTKNRTIEGLIEINSESCSQKCADLSLTFISSGDTKEGRQGIKGICNDVCSKGDTVLDIYKMGAENASKFNKTPDCTGAVADSSRSNMKAAPAIETNAANEAAKQASQK